MGLEGAQWLSGRVLDSRPRGSDSSLTCVTALWSLSRTHYPRLVLVQPRKTRPCLAERLLMGHKESNQTNKQMGLDARNPVFDVCQQQKRRPAQKSADQPAHLCSLISAFVIRLLESFISRLATSKISIFKLVSVAEETGLSLTLLETPKTGFVGTRPKSFWYYFLE